MYILVEDAAEIPSGFVNKLYSVSGSTGTSSSDRAEPEVKYDKESGATLEDSNA